jgi:hypothetical protein
MRAIITITEVLSMPGRYTVTCSARKDKRGYVHPTDVHGAEAAAAQALEYSIRCAGGYAIVGPAKVMQHIPDDMRSRA